MDLRAALARIKEEVSVPKVVGDDLVYERTITSKVSKKDLESRKKSLEAQIAKIDEQLGMFK